MKKKLVVLAALMAAVFLVNPPKAHAFCGGVSHNLGECLDICGCEYDWCYSHTGFGQPLACEGDWQDCQGICQEHYG